MSSSPPKPASTWRILLVFVGLAVLAGVFGFVALTRTGETTAAAVLDPAFETRALPFGFEARFAAELPFGQKLVRFAPRGAALASAPGSPVAEPAPAPGGGPGARTIAWRKLELAPPGAPPREAALVFLGQLGQDALRPYLENPAWKTFETLDDAGGQVAVESGTFPWSGFEARYTIVRRFEPPASWKDSARVDLSAHGRWCVLCADWPRGATASKDALVALASAFVPRPLEKRAP